MRTKALQEIILQAFKQLGAFVDLIDPNKRHIGFGNMRLLYHVINKSICCYFSHTKFPRIIHLANT